MNEVKKPPALNIYSECCEMLCELEAEEAGHVIIAICEYFLDCVVPENLSKVEMLTFKSLKNGVDRSVQSYQDSCAKKQQAALNMWNNRRENVSNY